MSHTDTGTGSSRGSMPAGTRGGCHFRCIAIEGGRFVRCRYIVRCAYLPSLNRPCLWTQNGVRLTRRLRHGVQGPWWRRTGDGTPATSMRCHQCLHPFGVGPPGITKDSSRLAAADTSAFAQ